MRHTRRENEIRDFKPDADALESLSLPFPGRMLLYLLVGLVVAGVLWASLSTVDRVVTAPGRLVTTSPRMVIQSLETSVIKELHVRVGDRVQAGQVVAVLDPSFIVADITALNAQRSRVTAQSARLTAEIEGREYRPTEGNEATRSQRFIFEQKQAAVKARLRSFDRKADELRTGKAVNARRIVRIREQAEILTELQSIQARLFKKDFGSRVDLLEARANRARVLEELEALEHQQLEIADRLRSNTAERNYYSHTLRQNTLEELVRTRKELSSLEESLAKAVRRQDLIRLAAPSDAVVFEMAERSVGSILREAEALMTLVPTDARIELLAEFEPSNIGKIKVGDPVRIKIDAFPFQVYGTLDGEVRTISSDAFIETAGTLKTLSYRAHIAMKSSDFARRPADTPLRPGMTASVEVIIGRRSVMSFLLYPVFRALDEAGREP